MPKWCTGHTQCTLKRQKYECSTCVGNTGALRTCNMYQASNEMASPSLYSQCESSVSPAVDYKLSLLHRTVCQSRVASIRNFIKTTGVRSYSLEWQMLCWAVGTWSVRGTSSEFHYLGAIYAGDVDCEISSSPLPATLSIQKLKGPLDGFDGRRSSRSYYYVFHLKLEAIKDELLDRNRFS